MTHFTKRRVPLIWFVLVSLHFLLLALSTFTTIFHDTAFEAFGMTAVVVPYVLQHIGLPVLENNGLSGGGWPSPNLFGWFFSVVAWFTLYWLIAIGVERLTRRSSGTPKKRGAP